MNKEEVIRSLEVYDIIIENDIVWYMVESTTKEGLAVGVKDMTTNITSNFDKLCIKDDMKIVKHKDILKLQRDINTPPKLDSNVEEAMEELGYIGLDELSTDKGIYLIHELKYFNTIKQAFTDMQQELDNREIYLLSKKDNTITMPKKQFNDMQREKYKADKFLEIALEEYKELELERDELESKLDKQSTFELVENNYEYVVAINGVARAVSKSCFKILQELKEETK